jgi:transcriptional regulator with XRE-family HTH domain
MSEAVRANRVRQCELYGAPLGDRVRLLTARLGISQAGLARVLGISPAMLSQLVSARRVKIGDPAVLARLRALDQGRAAHVTARDPQAVEKLLADIARLQWHWTGRRPGEAPLTAVDVLRSIAEPRRLAAAAAALASAFPEVAEVLRQAARADGPRPAA